MKTLPHTAVLMQQAEGGSGIGLWLFVGALILVLVLWLNARRRP